MEKHRDCGKLKRYTNNMLKVICKIVNTKWFTEDDFEMISRSLIRHDNDVYMAVLEVLAKRENDRKDYDYVKLRYYPDDIDRRVSSH